MGIKSQYIQTLISEPVEYHEEIIDELKHFKRNFKYSAINTPEGVAARVRGMQDMLDSFCLIMNLPTVQLQAANVETNGDSSSSFYCRETRTITIAYRLSIITLLHEFAHHIFIPTGNTETDEHLARRWSINLFKKVYPIAFEKLEMGSSEPNSFVLRMPRAGRSSRTALPAGYDRMLRALGQGMREITRPPRRIEAVATPVIEGQPITTQEVGNAV